MFEDDELPHFCLDIGLQLFQGRPPAKQQRFKTLKEEDLDQPLDGATAKSTKYAKTCSCPFCRQKHYLCRICFLKKFKTLAVFT